MGGKKFINASRFQFKNKKVWEKTRVVLKPARGVNILLEYIITLKEVHFVQEFWFVPKFSPQTERVLRIDLKTSADGIKTQLFFRLQRAFWGQNTFTFRFLTNQENTKKVSLKSRI